MAYITIDDFIAYAKADHLSTDDALVLDLISSAQGIVDAFTGRTFEADSDNAAVGSTDTYVTHYFDYDLDIDGYELFFDDDICEIGVVTNGDSNVIASSNYVTNPRNKSPYYSIKLLSSTSDMWTYTNNPENEITVTGVWAYSLTAPQAVQHATLRLTNWLYKQRVAEFDADRPVTTQFGFAVLPSSIPSDIKAILEPFRRFRL